LYFLDFSGKLQTYFSVASLLIKFGWLRSALVPGQTVAVAVEPADEALVGQHHAPPPTPPPLHGRSGAIDAGYGFSQGEG